jgi:hypothetical protein
VEPDDDKNKFQTAMSVYENRDCSIGKRCSRMALSKCDCITCQVGEKDGTCAAVFYVYFLLGPNKNQKYYLTSDHSSNPDNMILTTDRSKAKIWYYNSFCDGDGNSGLKLMMYFDSAPSGAIGVLYNRPPAFIKIGVPGSSVKFVPEFDPTNPDQTMYLEYTNDGKNMPLYINKKGNYLEATDLGSEYQTKEPVHIEAAPISSIPYRKSSGTICNVMSGIPDPCTILPKS